MDELVGQQVDHYLIERHLSRGGMADVYLARDVTLRRKVALKVMLAEIAMVPELTARFQREAEAVAQLSHPNVVQIYTIGRTPNKRPYLAMQFIEGGSLHAYLARLVAKGETMSTTAVLEIARQIASALNAAHLAGIVHRDLKPGNILLRADGTPVITDLGIAAVKTASTRLTRTGSVLGTPYYMAPEQARGTGEIDGRADIYALGVIIYEMLAGRVPFAADSPIAVLHQHLYEPPPPLFRIRRDLSEAMYETVDHCLEKDPTSRFQTASQLVAALERTLEIESGESAVKPFPPVSSASPEEPTSRRFKFGWWIAPLLFMALVLLGFGVYRLFSPPEPTTPGLVVITPEETGERERTEAPTGADPSATAQIQPLPAVAETPVATDTALPSPSPVPPTETAAPSPTPIPTDTPEPAPTLPLLPIPALVPPSGRIVFTCYIDAVDDLCAINGDGGMEARLTAVAATDFYASYTPDGSQIVFSSRRDGSFLMYVMNANGSDQRQMGPTHVGGIYAPAISPDGQSIAFTAASGGSQNIWLMDRNGVNLRQLTFFGGNSVDASWSPDGHQIAFASDKDDPESEQLAHYIMNVDGTGVRKLETGVADIGGRSDWSPDGRWLAIYAGQRNDREIYLVASDGSIEIQLTHGGNNLAPSFSPDGNWIAFTSYRDGDAEIFIMRSDGSDVSQLTFNERPDWQPRWGP